MTLSRSYTPEEREAIQALKSFIVDNPELEQLEDILEEFNIFEALGIGRQELRHSNFFAWLMNPKGSHGLGDYFLKQFIRKLAKLSDDERIDDLLFNIETKGGLTDTEVFREWNHIDIFITNKSFKFTTTIENKFLSDEHGDQLGRYAATVESTYPDFLNIFIYLTPDQRIPLGSDRFTPIGYIHIVEIIEHILKVKSSVLSEDVKTLLRHYVAFIRRFLMSGEIEKLCMEIYKKHKKALDLIYEYVKSSSIPVLIRNMLVDLLPTKGFKIFYDSRSYIRFLPEDWNFIPLVSSWKISRQENMPLICFEFYNTEQYGLILYLLCTPLMKDKALQYASTVNMLLLLGTTIGKPFRTPRNVEKSLKGLLEGSTDRVAICSYRVCTPREYESLSIEEIKDKVESFLDSFKEKELKVIHEGLFSVFK